MGPMAAMLVTWLSKGTAKMKHIISSRAGFVVSLALASATLTLSGCITDDARFDDQKHSAISGSQQYPLTGHRPCGQWPEDLTESPDNTPYSNFGCAVQTNIANETVNGQSLYHPHAVELAPAARSSKAVGTVINSSSASSGFSFP